MENEIIITNPQSLRNIIQEVVKEQLHEYSKWFENKINTDGKLLTRHEALEYLGVSSSTLYRWTREGLIQSHGCGSKVFYKLSELQASLVAIK